MEKKKLLLVSVSVGLFLVIVIGVSILAFSPKSYSAVESVRAAALQSAGSRAVVSSGGRLESVPPPPVPPLDAVPPPAPVNADGQTPRYPNNSAGQPPAGQAGGENIIYINGENPENVKVERANDGTSRTYINIHSTPVVKVESAPVEAAPSNAAGAVAATKPNAPVKSAVKSAAAPKPASPAAAPKSGQSSGQAARQTALSPAAAKAAQAAPARKSRITDYWVQAGAFGSKSHADNACGVLALKGIASIIQDSTVNGKIWYRVRVGPYTSQNEANYWLSLIKEIEGMEKSLVLKSSP
ncbi:MAG: SPOR domain-containing protein [Spirochaetaceae bacterium]|jgi:DedD protein|nr:SPOR domain-containing protein [Spirochaetaceae bacterium]